MSPAKFLTLFFFIIITVFLVLFFRTIPPSVIFRRSPPVPQPVVSSAAPVPVNQPQEILLPASLPRASGWSTLSLPDWQLQFDYPDSWGTPSASLTRFSSPDSGTLTGIYFIQNALPDTPVFLELTSADYKNTASASAVLTAVRGNLTNTVMTDGVHFAYYTFALFPSFPRLKIYVSLPEIHSSLPDTDLTGYFNTTSARIFSGTGLSATDSANLKNFLQLVSSVRFLTPSASPALIPPYNLK